MDSELDLSTKVIAEAAIPCPHTCDERADIYAAHKWREATPEERERYDVPGDVELYYCPRCDNWVGARVVEVDG